MLKLRGYCPPTTNITSNKVLSKTPPQIFKMTYTEDRLRTVKSKLESLQTPMTTVYLETKSKVPNPYLFLKGKD